VELQQIIHWLVVNGVDVMAFVNEHDRWYSLRFVQPKVMGATHSPSTDWSCSS
jgi:hypothetical protein